MTRLTTDEIEEAQDLANRTGQWVYVWRLHRNMDAPRYRITFDGERQPVGYVRAGSVGPKGETK